ncbi:MAG: peptidoglycan bridge formation glycyltransferase FemA/FemB family protein [Candidatus Saccharimonadales bacterium]
MKLIELETNEWDEFVYSHPNGHPFQLSKWGELKSNFSWSSVIYGIKQNNKIVAGAQVLLLDIPLIKRKLAYIPRGPIADRDQEMIEILDLLGQKARELGAISLKVEPAIENLNFPKGWRKSSNTILHPETIIKDLGLENEDQLYSSLNSEVRYSVRRATREGVSVKEHQADKLPKEFWSLYQETAKRSDFNIHTLKYYDLAYSLLKPYSRIWLARDEQDKAIGFVWMFKIKTRSIFLYAGSDDIARKTLANYLLQWEAIRGLYQDGVKEHDLNGNVTAGVGGYKKKFASREVTWVGSYDLPLSKTIYFIWERLLPATKPILRKVKHLKEIVNK